MRLNLGTLGPEYWTSSTLSQGSEVELAATARASLDGSSAGADGHDAQIVSNRSTCTTCGGQRFDTYLEQRAHFATDVHKYNARRRAAGRPFVTVEEFEALAERQDAASLGSISASDDGNSSSDDATESESVAAREGRRAAAASVKVEFIDPVNPDKFILLYKAALPDLLSLASLGERGGWAVIMSGGGHFAASIWDKAGNVVKHKTFHRYTSRAKQGGSQAAADAQGGKCVAPCLLLGDNFLGR
jgi:Bacteroidetes VLRF1 release factor